MNENKPIIYGVKTNDNKFHYIGKTKRKQKVNHKMNKSDATRQYSSSSIRSFFQANENVEVVQIKQTNDAVWYDEKLSEVVKTYKENHPLLNAQWMLEGKRGAWSGKKRDANTLKRLSESKHRKVIQYDKDGNYIKTWDSAKQVAIEIFKDYRIKRGSACSKFYGILSSKTLDCKLRHGSYWFKESELKQYFNLTPTKIKISVIRENEKLRKRKESKPYDITTYSRYTVVQYNLDGTIKRTYENTFEAGYFLRLPSTTVSKICGGRLIDPYIILKYGKKTQQPIKVTYPEYVSEPRSAHYPQKLPIVKPIKEKKVYIKTRTRSSVEQYIDNVLVRRFDDIFDAAKNLKLTESRIRNIISYHSKNTNLDLRLGAKKQIPLSDILTKKDSKSRRTKELCQIEALKYKTRSEFKKHDEATWRASHRHGWIDEICSHMPKNVYKNN